MESEDHSDLTDGLEDLSLSSDSTQAIAVLESEEEEDRFPIFSMPGIVFDVLGQYLSPFDIENICRTQITATFIMRKVKKQWTHLTIEDQMSYLSVPDKMLIVVGIGKDRYEREYKMGTFGQMNSSPEYEAMPANDGSCIFVKRTHVDTINDGLVRAFNYTTKTCGKGFFDTVHVNATSWLCILCDDDWPAIWCANLEITIQRESVEDESILHIIQMIRPDHSLLITGNADKSSCRQITLSKKFFSNEKIFELPTLSLTHVIVPSDDDISWLLSLQSSTIHIEPLNMSKERVAQLVNAYLKEWRDNLREIEDVRFVMEQKPLFIESQAFEGLPVTRSVYHFEFETVLPFVEYHKMKRRDGIWMYVWLSHSVILKKSAKGEEADDTRNASAWHQIDLQKHRQQDQ